MAESGTEGISPSAMDAEFPPKFFSAFVEWRRHCALAACAAQSATVLRGFIHARFDGFCRRYAPFAASGARHPLTPPPADCWHLFETHLAVDQTRAGKRYKQWLFEAARAGEGSPAARLAGGATLLLRDVVRAWLAREAPEPRTQSLQAPLGAEATGDALTLEELLPDESDPADEAARRELEALAAEEAARLWRTLDRRDRLLLAARERGLRLDDEALARAAGIGKSALYARYRALLERLAKQLRHNYPREDPAALSALVRLLIRDLGRRAEKIFPEKSRVATFYTVKGQRAPRRDREKSHENKIAPPAAGKGR